MSRFRFRCRRQCPIISDSAVNMNALRVTQWHTKKKEGRKTFVSTPSRVHSDVDLPGLARPPRQQVVPGARGYTVHS